MVEEHSERNCRVRMEALQRVVSHVIQHLEEVPLYLVEPCDDPVVHPEVGAVGEGVAVLLADGHARVGGSHVGKDEGRDNLGAEPGEVLVVPGRRDAGEDAWVGVNDPLLLVRVPEDEDEVKRSE